MLADIPSELWSKIIDYLSATSESYKRIFCTIKDVCRSTHEKLKYRFIQQKLTLIPPIKRKFNLY